MDQDKIKLFFVNHIEKIILGGVTCCSLGLIYHGISQDSYNQTTPTELQTDAKDVFTKIDLNHTDVIMEDRLDDFDIIAKTMAAQGGIDDSGYSFQQEFVRKSADSSIKRSDPALEDIAPLELLVSGQAFVFAKRGNASGDYDLQDLDDADALERPAQRRPRRSRRVPRGGPVGGGPPGGDGSPYGGGPPGGGSPYGAAGPGGGPSMASSANRKFDDEADFGIVAKNTTEYDGTRAQKPIPVTTRFIAATALMPHKLITDAYKLALRDAAGYDESRDLPSYAAFEVQRADVTETPINQLTEDSWVKIHDRLSLLRTFLFDWSNFSPEPVPEKYRDIAFTTWLPPILIDDYRHFAVHPRIPLALDDQKGPAEEEEKEVDRNIDLSFKSGGARSTRTPVAGPGLPGMTLGGSAVEDDTVENKLIRFYDFYSARDANSPKPGRKYVYRVRVGVEDPNFPGSLAMQPEMKNLAPDVYQRVIALLEESKVSNLRDSTLWTNWSDPSVAVSLPDTADSFAGAVAPIKMLSAEVAGHTVSVPRDDRKAKMVIRGLDMEYNGMVPMLMDVREGTVLSKADDEGEIVDPITLKVMKRPNAKILSQSTVIGIEGGNSLDIVAEDKMTEPSMMLLYDADGGLRVTSEVADQEFYRAWSFAEDRGE